jgi:hypothetical protein
MAGGRWATAGAIAAGLLAGGAGGWVAGRLSAQTPPPPPAVYVNPLADAHRGENVFYVRNDGARVQYRVEEESPDTVLLVEETSPKGQPSTRNEIRVSRTFFGPLIILGGTVNAAAAESALVDFQLQRAEQETIRVDALGRSLRCWKFAGSHKVQGSLTFWISEELPVHGLVRVETARGRALEIGGYSFGK